MKKFIYVLLSVLLCGAVAAGCKGDKNKNVDSKDTNSVLEQTASIPLSDGAVTEDNYSDFITLCKYENIDIDWSDSTNSYYLSNALDTYEASTKKITDRAVKNGDIANIDYAGYKDGVAFSGGTAEGYDLSIGSGSFIDGFEEGLIGVMPGESVDLNLTFPENYSSEDLAGKDVVFKVKVNYISEKAYSDEDTKSAKKEVFDTVLLNYVVENSQYKSLPKDTVEEYDAQYLENYKNSAVSQYGTLEAFLSAQGMTEEEFNSTIREMAINRTKVEIAVYALAGSEKIRLTDAEYESGLKSYADMNSTTPEAFETANKRENIESALLREKVSQMLIARNEIK